MQADVPSDAMKLDATQEDIRGTGTARCDCPGTFDEAAATEKYMAKAKKYYRCMTCKSQPVREYSHFRLRRSGQNSQQCRKQPLTDTEEAEWVAEHVNALRVQYSDARESGITDAEVTKWYEAKVRSYYRCMTCTSQPIRERSHFQRHRGRASTKPCRRQRLTQTEEAAWITTRSKTLRNGTDVSAEAHRIIAKRLKHSQHRTVKTCDKAKQRVCNICTRKFPRVPIQTGQHCCATCHRSFELGTPVQRSNHRQHPDRALVCTNCRANGYHPRDVCAYECRSCHGLFGRKNFNSRSIHAFVRGRQGKPTCGRCSSSSAKATTTARHHPDPRRKIREPAKHSIVDTPVENAALTMKTPLIAEVRNP